MNSKKPGVKLEAYIENPIKESKNHPELGFDLSLLKRNELYVNLIHFDLNMTSPENYKYYNDFKVDVVGGFLAMDNLDMFQKYLEVIQNKNKNIPFIVISSGSSGKDVIPICKQYKFVKEVIIFCGNYDYNKHYLDEYPGYVNRVFTDINDVYNYIKTFGPNKYKEGIENYRNSDQFIFSYDDIKMDKQLEQCPVISAYEYDKCYFLIHRTYAHFFEFMNNNGKITLSDDKVTLTTENYDQIEEFINSSNLEIINAKDKSDLISKFKELENSPNFVELSIRTYSGESYFCYLFNRVMRNFEEGLMSLSYYMGPLLFGLNKYVKENPQNFSFSEDMTLCRNIRCSIYDFYLYKMNLNHIICFPSITSTSLTKGKFKPTKKSKKLNDKGFKEEDMIKLTMIFYYKHEPGNISPGIIIKDYYGSDGIQISTKPKENEVILFPFTFARIIKIKEKPKTEITYQNAETESTHEIYFNIINRKEYIEYKLKNDVHNRISFSQLDKNNIQF